MTDAPRLQRNLMFGWEAARREQPADEPRPASLSSPPQRLFCRNGGRAGPDTVVIPGYSAARLFWTETDVSRCGTASRSQDYIRCTCHRKKELGEAALSQIIYLSGINREAYRMERIWMTRPLISPNWFRLSLFELPACRG